MSPVPALSWVNLQLVLPDFSQYKSEKLGGEILNQLFRLIENSQEEICEVEYEIVAPIPTAATFAQNLQNKINMKTTPKNICLGLRKIQKFLCIYRMIDPHIIRQQCYII